MDGCSSLPVPPADAAVALHRPCPQRLAVVVASPHSGCDYPPQFLAAAALDPETLRRSEDSFVDEIMAGAVDHGAPLLAARFPRAYLDVNREADELDPLLINDPLPPHLHRRSQRVVAGLGTIPRVVAAGVPIYPHRLSLAEAQARIDTHYRPYHALLRHLVDHTRHHFGHCILVDAHSMPPSSVGAGPWRSAPVPDIVLGDCFGKACAPEVMETAETVLENAGYHVRRNRPYAGGFTTSHYGAPRQNAHALQVEINRAVYMNPETRERHAGLAPLAETMARMVAALGTLVPAPPRR